MNNKGDRISLALLAAASLLFGGEQGSSSPTRPTNIILNPRMMRGFRIMVGVIGFEPTTPWSQTRCATGLRYTP
jgi:hypothetical protein